MFLGQSLRVKTYVTPLYLIAFYVPQFNFFFLEIFLTHMCINIYKYINFSKFSFIVGFVFFSLSRFV